MLKIVAISDHHCQHEKLKIPKCDILISCGDWTYNGNIESVTSFAKWLNEQDASHIVITAGNHEDIFSKCYPQSRNWILDHCPAANILIHESIEIEGVKIFGSPWTPYFCNWAYNGARNESEKALYNVPLMKDFWKDIPDDTDIIVTHGMPYMILDDLKEGGNVGCVDLYNRILEVKPDLVFGGHLHFKGGQSKEINGTKFFNAAVCNDNYKVVNPITIVKYEPRHK